MGIDLFILIVYFFVLKVTSYNSVDVYGFTVELLYLTTTRVPNILHKCSHITSSYCFLHDPHLVISVYYQRSVFVFFSAHP